MQIFLNYVGQKANGHRDFSADNVGFVINNVLTWVKNMLKLGFF